MDMSLISAQISCISACVFSCCFFFSANLVRTNSPCEQGLRVRPHAPAWMRCGLGHASSMWLLMATEIHDIAYNLYVAIGGHVGGRAGVSSPYH